VVVGVTVPAAMAVSVAMVIVPMAVMVMIMSMFMMVVPMAMGMVVMIVPVAIMVMEMCGLLRFERAGHRCCNASQSAHQFRDSRSVLDEDGVCDHFDRNMAAPGLPGEPQQTHRIFGPNFQQLLRSSGDLDQPAILKLHRITVVERRRLVEIEGELAAALASQDNPVPLTLPMIQKHRIDNLVGLHGRLADDGFGAEHRVPQTDRFQQSLAPIAPA